MSRRLSLDPSMTATHTVLGEISPNRTGPHRAGDRQRRKSSLAAYTSMFGGAKDEQTGEFERETENLTQENATYGGQPRQARRLSIAMARPRGGSLQDNLTGEFNAGARSARKMNQRQEGVDGGRASIIMMPDRRDFSSSEGRLAGIRKLVEFLASRGYPYPLSKEDLISPTVATYREILVSIASLVDPFATEDIALRVKSKGPWETAVCQFFKNIRYPWNLSPKQIASVGSANAWPKFLGALVWLVDLIEVGEFQVEAAIFQENERLQMEAMQTAYKRYMQGDDSAVDQLLLKLRSNADAQGLQLKKAVTEAEARVKELKIHLNRMTGAPGDVTEDGTTSFTGTGGITGAAKYSVDSLRMELDNYRTDIRKLSGAIEMWKKKTEIVQASCAAEEKRLGTLQNELEDVRTKRDAEQQKLDSQVLKNSDLSRIAAERNRLEKALEDVSQEKESLTSQVWTVKDRTDRAMEALQAKVHEINRRSQRLVQRSRDRTGVVDLDVQTMMGPQMNAQLDKFSSFMDAQFEKFLALADDARKRSLELQDLSDRNAEECAAIEMQIEAHKHDTRRIDERNADEARHFTSELEMIETETRSAQKQLDAVLRTGQCVEEEEEVLHLKRELERQTQQFQEETQRYNNDLNTALQILIDFKVEVESIVDHAKQQVESSVSKSDGIIRSHASLVAQRL